MFNKDENIKFSRCKTCKYIAFINAEKTEQFFDRDSLNLFKQKLKSEWKRRKIYIHDFPITFNDCNNCEKLLLKFDNRKLKFLIEDYNNIKEGLIIARIKDIINNNDKIDEINNHINKFKELQNFKKGYNNLTEEDCYFITNEEIIIINKKIKETSIYRSKADGSWWYYFSELKNFNEINFNKMFQHSNLENYFNINKIKNKFIKKT